MSSREGGFGDLQRSHETRPILKFLFKCSNSSCPSPIHRGSSPAWLSQAEPINPINSKPGMMSQGLHSPHTIPCTLPFSQALLTLLQR